MRRTGRVAQLSLLLTCTALLLLLVTVAWLASPQAGPAVAQPEGLLTDQGGELLAGQSITPTTILEIFFSSSAGQQSAESGTAVQADLETLASGDPPNLEGPVFSWNPGTYSMDWGDLDRDGDLDLIAASVEGVVIYANDQGQFHGDPMWPAEYSGLGVRWFDLDPGAEPNLEAVVVGESTDGQPTSPGTMAIFLQPEVSSSFVEYTVPEQLLRVEPGDFDGDGEIDLVASTNALEPPSGCPVVLFRRQEGDLPYGDTGSPECVSDQATASLAAAYVDDDEYLDLALGLHSSKEIRVVLSNGLSLTITNSLLVDSSLAHIPYDLAWGDYNGDGWLDLAAAFPLEQEVRIYDNNDGATFTKRHILTTDTFLTPLALDWADLDGDGRLELIVGDLPPKIYDYDGAEFTVMDMLPVQTGRVQEIRAIDTDNDADLDVAVANQYASSELFANTAPLLSPSLTSVSGAGARSVAWGDADGDVNGYLDLLIGGELYAYDAGSGAFESITPVPNTAETGAFGNFDGDGDLEVVLGSQSACTVYPRPDWQDPIFLDGCSDPSSLAWADCDDDGFLDLAVAAPSGITVYKGIEAGGTFPVLWSSLLTGGAQDVAWADYDGDHWLDLAVARGTQGVLLYHHELDGSLAAGTALNNGCNARSLAWGDWDGDGDEDLAVGCHGGPNLIYENANGTWEGAPIGEASQTTSLAWGDWDNDGDLDLAVGSEGQSDQVYDNQDGTLVLRWVSAEEWSTNALAWGDWDMDGDLDLAVTASNGSGWYANNYVLPAHLGDPYTPLPRNPSYLSVARPGTTPGAYFYSSPEILAGPETDGMVEVTYTQYDPESDPVAHTSYEYSPDGGGHWIATTNVSIASWTTSTHEIEYTLEWNAREDGAVSDSTRFRIAIVHGEAAGPVQRATTSAVSPPFRVRATSCVWPSGLSILMDPEEPEEGENVEFIGLLEEGSGTLSFDWDMGDGQTLVGQLVHHRYDRAGTYTVTLTVTGTACPVTRPVMDTKTFDVYEARSTGGTTDQHSVYLPLILRRDAVELP